MSEKETIISKIKKALQTPTHRSIKNKDLELDVNTARLTELIQSVLPKYYHTFEDNLELFKRNADDLKADFFVVDRVEDLVEKLIQIKETEKWSYIATHNSELTIAVCERLGLPCIVTNKGYDVYELEKCDAGITLCDALVAQTGSVVVTSKSTGGRALTVLPPHHIVIAKKEQLLGNLSQALDLLKAKYGDDFPSMTSFITGPSRTGDIERILVLGAHGPKKLTIFLLMEKS